MLVSKSQYAALPKMAEQTMVPTIVKNVWKPAIIDGEFQLVLSMTPLIPTITPPNMFTIKKAILENMRQ